MPPLPSRHTSDHEELVALIALGVLDEAERLGFAPHLLGCRRCQALLAQDSQTVAWLDATFDLEPSRGFKQRLMQRASEQQRQWKA